jgi:uncharacterized protein YegJ (DUF2314 family)
MQMPSWELVDADPITAEHKYAFYKPSRALIKQLSRGDSVKLVFSLRSDDPGVPGAERMWVEITEICRDGAFRGLLKNTPEYITDLEFGDRLAFEACHIINTQLEDNDNLVERFIKKMRRDPTCIG